MNKIKQIGLAALALLGFATTGNGATVTTFDPQFTAGGVNLYMTIENPNEGTYDSAEHDFYAPIAAFSPTFTIPNGAPANNFSGWSVANNAGTAELSNNGGSLFGSPTYTQWDTETMGNNAFVSEASLESNGIPGYQPFSLADLQSGSFDPSQFDHSIFLTSNDIFNLNGSNQVVGTSIVYSGTHTFNELGTFTASEGTFQYVGSAPKYVVESPNSYAVPEPSTYAAIVSLLALGAAGMKRPRRRE